MTKIVGLICLVALVCRCGQAPSKPGPTAEELIQTAWGYYGEADYEKAIEKFQQAAEISPDLAEAYSGLGWTYAKTGQLQDSSANFQLAVDKDPQNTDAWAGLAGTYLATNNYGDAVGAAQKALELDPSYSSVHDDVDARSLHLLMAECYYNMEQYALAQAQVDILQPNNNLNPQDPDYVENLLKKIEELSQ